MVGKCMEIDRIVWNWLDLRQSPSKELREKDMEDYERRNALSKKLVILYSMHNWELQSCIYRRLALISLAHMAQDNWLVNSTCALWIKPCVKWTTCDQILANSS